MAVSGLYILSVLTTMGIPVLAFIINSVRIVTPATGNPTYNAANRIILMYSIGASLLFYGMMVYLFTALPTYAPLALLLIDLVLILASLGTLFTAPWQVRQWKSKRFDVSGSDPSFVAISVSIISILVILPLVMLWYQSVDQRLGILLLLNLLVIPFFFLTSSTINSFALSALISDLKFTHNSHEF